MSCNHLGITWLGYNLGFDQSFLTYFFPLIDQEFTREIFWITTELTSKRAFHYPGGFLNLAYSQNPCFLRKNCFDFTTSRFLFLFTNSRGLPSLMPLDLIPQTTPPCFKSGISSHEFAHIWCLTFCGGSGSRQTVCVIFSVLYPSRPSPSDTHKFLLCSCNCLMLLHCFEGTRTLSKSPGIHL